jgi:NAD(P)-dependent dehydrogenase (short-subunit alcohol dehydrogenase family)
MDINPEVSRVHSGGDFLGIACDVTDPSAISEALERGVKAFGGIDMLVLNAGVFGGGQLIAMLDDLEWRKVMQINLDANLGLMRESHPLLKLAPRGGRVVIIGSKNVPAPGPGAAAYSASKAALNQLGRVAALEWGADGIRVNILHPNAVFDTGIWSDEVLAARAAHYGSSVEDYKRRNVLRTEVTSHDVAELAAEMCGPLFAKTTGAQVPIDGGKSAFESMATAFIPAGAMALWKCSTSVFCHTRSHTLCLILRKRWPKRSVPWWCEARRP